jgi:glycerol-3-phosphate dehydrogenase
VHSVVGGKLTTHRSFAERTVSHILGVRSPSTSRDLPLPGGDGPRDFADELWWRHGSRARLVRGIAAERPDLALTICPHRSLLRAEAVYALRHQAAMTFADLMLRRLFHSQGPCLRDPCLTDCHALFAEHARMPRSGARVDIADLRVEVAHGRGDLES